MNSWGGRKTRSTVSAVPPHCVTIPARASVPNFHVAVDANEIDFVERLQAEGIQAIGDRHQRIGEGMFAPVETRLADRMDDKASGGFADNGRAGIVAETFEPKDDHRTVITCRRCAFH